MRVQGRGARKLGLDIGEWRLDIGKWRLDIGKWRLDIGDWILGNGEWILEKYECRVLGNRDWELGNEKYKKRKKINEIKNVDNGL